MSPPQAKGNFIDIPLEERNPDKEGGNRNEHGEPSTESTLSPCKNIDAQAKKIRRRIHKVFYNWGYLIQSHHLGFFVLGMLLLILPCFGIKYLSIETGVEKLLIESEGRLHSEQKFTEHYMKGFGGFGEQMFGAETLIQTVKNENQNILTLDNMKEHLNMLQKVMRLKVTFRDIDWGLEDFCVKYNTPFFGSNMQLSQLIKDLSPCYVMTPVDCFFEGAYITTPPSRLDDIVNYINFSPKTLLDRVKMWPGSQFQYKPAKEFLDKIGASDGYQAKPCLLPEDKRCVNKGDGKKLDLGSILTGGCNGIAQNYMHWPEELVVSGTVKNSSGYIKSAKALQSVIAIHSVESFARHVDYQKVQMLDEAFSKKDAEDILFTWKKEFTKLVNEESAKSELKTKMLGFSTVSFQDLVAKQSMFQTKNAVVGFLLIIFYAIITLKRWSNAIYSYGAMGLVGVVLITLSVCNGLGLSHFLKMPLSALSIQVLPYLALGLGLDNMFLLVRTYVFVCDSGEFVDRKIVGMCLGECGLSITITSFANACAFFMASIIPIVTLQNFARQASIIVVVNWFAIIFVLPAILSFDIERQKEGLYDLLCCFKSNDEDSENDIDKKLNLGSTLNQNLAENVKSDNADCGKSLATPFPIVNPVDASQANNSSNENKKFVLDRSRRQFNVKPTVEQPQEESPESSACNSFIQKISLTYFAQNYYGRYLTCVQVKIIVLFVCCIQLFLAGYGSTKVNKGLNLVDMVPKNTPEHDFMSARKKYFSFYKFFMVTKYEENGKIFDYAKIENQKALSEFHSKIEKVNNVLTADSNGEPEFWYPIYRNWLKDIERKFRNDWRTKKIRHDCVPSCSNATLEAKLVYRLLSTSSSEEVEKSKPFSEKLVDRDGMINTRLFYYGLTVWYWFDNLGISKSQVGLRPEPPNPMQKIPFVKEFGEMFKARPEFMMIPFAAHNLRNNDDYTNLIVDVRGICADFLTSFGLFSYPMGIPFTYWEQFMFLERYLFIAGAVVLASTGVFILITFMSLRAAVIVVFFLAVTFFEIYGFMGLMEIELSGIPAVTLIMAVGVGFEFTVHIVLAFINTPGDRNDRMRGALEITFAPMFDSATSTIIMLLILSASQFDFVLKYFFHLNLCLICTALVNGALILPVVLSFFGPCCEVSNRSVGPSLVPVYHIPITIDITANFYNHRTRRNRNQANKFDLSTIPEVSERSSPSLRNIEDDQASIETTSQKSCRPTTPFPPDSSPPLETSDCRIEANIETATFRNRTESPAWHHTPKLHESENSKYNIGGCNRLGHGPRKKTNFRNMRQFPPSCTFSSSSSITARSTAQIQNIQSRKLSKGLQNPRTPCATNDSATNINNNYSSNNNSNNNSHPRFIHVQPCEESMCSTKLKATLSIEVETSHPYTVTSSAIRDDYDDRMSPVTY